MRFLKRKVQLELENSLPKAKPHKTKKEIKISMKQPFTIIRKPVEKKNKRENKVSDKGMSKNIVKNYGKAMGAFAASDLALPYLDELAKREEVDKNRFINFMATYKESTDSIDSLRAMLLITESDSKEMAGFKRIFKELCEIFLKYFSVNWIFHGKMFHKTQHLKYRYKMLRRVKQPEMFTYLTTKLK